ncbi:hypothetical protein X801_10696, partial [Opisthorchis viverrini]
MNQLNEDKLCAFLKRHPHIVERYVVENCTQMTLNQWSSQLAKRRVEQDLSTDIPVDGSTLYLKDTEGKFIYVHDLDQPMWDPAEGVPKFEINSRKLLACYAVETGKCVFSDELPKDVAIERYSRAVHSEAKYVIAHPIMLSEDEIIGVIEIYRAAPRRPFSDAEKQLTKSIVRWAQLVLASDEVCTRMISFCPR